MRTFQYSDARSHKFWHIEVSGASYTVTYGKVGAKGQTTTKTFPSPDKAQQAADKVIAEKVGKGYRETTPSQRPPSLADALEQAILDDPEDLAAHAAYADFLQEQGDPRGEFIQTQLALDNPDISSAERKTLQEREQALLKKHQKEWVGEWVDRFEHRKEGEGALGSTDAVPFVFVRGILAEARISDLTVAAARAFAAAPQTHLVRRLSVGECEYDEEYEEGPDIPEDAEEDMYGLYPLLRWPGLANLRVFQLGWIPEEVYDDYCSHNCHTSGELAHHFVKQMPRVEELYLLAHRVEAGKLFTMDLPRLRILQLYHNTEYPLERLAKNASLGNLTHLLCHPHALDMGDDENAYIRLKDLRAVIKSPHLKSLTHLRLRLADFGDEGVAEVIKSGILKRLKVLDFRHGAITDAGARALAACPDLANLELLDLSRNLLTAEGVAALEATGVKVDVSRQHGPDDDEEFGEPAYLYEGDIE